MMFDFNDIAINFFYVLAKRNVYGIILTISMREFLRTKQKEKLYYSPDTSKELYLQDIVDQMQSVEKEVITYKQKGSRSQFSDFFELTGRMDSTEMCDIIDSYQVGQSGLCNDNYGGPKDQGLTAGMSYYIDYCVLYIQKMRNTDFTNDTAVSEILSEDGFFFPATKVYSFLQSALELQLVTYEKEAEQFYELISVISLVKGICFAFIYALFYSYILYNLCNKLKMEIWLGYGLLNMIPSFILEKNSKVQQNILKITNGSQQIHLSFLQNIFHCVFYQ